MHLPYCELSAEILLVPSVFHTTPYEKDQGRLFYFYLWWYLKSMV